MASATPSSGMGDDGETRAAGRFSVWLGEIEGALRGERESDVPCDGCTACCRSFQFVHIEPDEVDALAHIPSEYLFPAPTLPIGNVLMGYDAQGCCPMLVDDACTIYAHRPRTCRTYDCRIFPATGVELEGGEYVEITRRTRTWRFEFVDDVDRAEFDAVRAAADFVAEVESGDDDASASTHPIRRAVLALETYRSFLDES